jgi:hypothetical protein
MKLRGERDRFGTVGRPADDGEVRIGGERFGESEGEEVVIVRDQDC